MTGEEAHDLGDDLEEVGPHVYAIVDARVTSVDGMTGLDGTPLRLVREGAVGAVVNDVRLERPPGRRADLVAYSRVLDALADAGPVVPVQFGSVLLDDDSVVEDVLQDREEHYLELLDQVAGHAQFHLRATYQPDVALGEVVASDVTITRLREHTRSMPEDAAHADRVRLGELVGQALESKRAADADALLDVVAPHVSGVHVTLGSGTDDLATFSLLVADSYRQTFEDELEALAEAVHERIRLGLVGPMAPYDFADGA